MNKKIFSIILSIIFIPTIASAVEYTYTKDGFKYPKHEHYESSYQHAWCSAHKGIEEYENKDFTRVDCLTDVHAVEFDFANKWAESVGQAEYYALMTGKKGMVVLILENPQKEMVYFNRVKKLAEAHNLDAEYVTPAILNIKDGKCPYLDCKCHKVKKK